MRTLSALAMSTTLAMVAACGGGESIQGPTEDDEIVRLDFSAIAGTWSGWAVEPREENEDVQFWARFDLEASADQGASVGTIEEGLTPGVTACVGDLLAEEAGEPVYTVREIVTSGLCPTATVRLEHDPEAGTLTVNWTAANTTGSGVLTRGSDPGPQP